jgi:hypothetical protein
METAKENETDQRGAAAVVSRTKVVATPARRLEMRSIAVASIAISLALGTLAVLCDG